MPTDQGQPTKGVISFLSHPTKKRAAPRRGGPFLHTRRGYILPDFLVSSIACGCEPYRPNTHSVPARGTLARRGSFTTAVNTPPLPLVMAMYCLPSSS